MAKRSGFQITVRAFIAADAFDAESLASARARISRLESWLQSESFLNVLIEEKPRHRVEVPDAPEPTAPAVTINDPPAQAVGLAVDPLALPPHLDRRNRA